MIYHCLTTMLVNLKNLLSYLNDRLFANQLYQPKNFSDNTEGKTQVKIFTNPFSISSSSFKKKKTLIPR